MGFNSGFKGLIVAGYSIAYKEYAATVLCPLRITSVSV
jgi:hypothetical protein